MTGVASIVRGGCGKQKHQKRQRGGRFLAFRQNRLPECTMDTTDLRLIALLRQDARATVATLAAKLGVSRGTVANRLRRLQDEGVIVGYTVRLRPDAQPKGITAWMSITVDGNQTREVIAHLLGEPGVASLHDTNGRWDLLAELRAADLGELAGVLDRVRLIKGIAGTETSIHLKTYRLS